MEDNRYRRKVRKLLALAQSDNEHEAERAKSQAKAMMAKYNINADHLEIIEKEATRAVRRKIPKDYEIDLLNAIAAISGCETYWLRTYDFPEKSRSLNMYWFTYPGFMGMEPDALMAAYCWDVLYEQMEQKRRDLKKQMPSIKADQMDHYLAGWVFSVKGKLTNVFGHRETPKTVCEYYEQKSEDWEPTEMRETEMDEVEESSELIRSGMEDGKNARLNAAADDQSEKPQGIEQQ